LILRHLRGERNPPFGCHRENDKPQSLVKTLISRGMEKTGAETRTQLYAMVTERMAA
jgi:hypothetical protein